MNNRLIPLLLLSMAGIAIQGCSGNDMDVPPGNDMQLNLTGSKQGQAVGFADVDGDGTEDKLVGAPEASVAGRTGAVLVYQGVGSSYNTNPMMVMTGDDNLGFSLVNIGDVDADAKDDFAVGAINGSGDEATAASLCGTVSIYKGGSKWQLIKKLAGDAAMDKFGFSLAAGDLNNDGYNDLVVGAPFNTNDPARYQGGAVYVYFGPAFTSRVALYASATHSGLGWAVATGDVNGDAIADLLFSASGKILGFYGAASFAPAIGSPNLIVSSSATGFGKAIAVIGDLTGDGNKELAVGAPNATINGNRDTGSVYIIKGGTGTRNINLNTPPADQLVRIDGNGLFNRFGSAILALGDLDSDNLPDFAVGASMTDVNTNDLSGRVYLFKGVDIGPATTLANSTAFNGMTRNQAFGASLASNKKGQMIIGGPRSTGDTGGVSLVDPKTGNAVSGGSSGGSTGGGGECH